MRSWGRMPLRLRSKPAFAAMVDMVSLQTAGIAKRGRTKRLRLWRRTPTVFLLGVGARLSPEVQAVGYTGPWRRPGNERCIRRSLGPAGGCNAGARKDKSLH